MRSFFSNYLAAAPYYWAGHHPVFIFILRYSCYTTVCIKIFHVQTREIRGFSDFNWHYQFHDIIRGFLWFQPALAVSRYFWPFSPRTFCCFENLTSINMNHSIVYSKKHGWNPYKVTYIIITFGNRLKFYSEILSGKWGRFYRGTGMLFCYKLDKNGTEVIYKIRYGRMHKKHFTYRLEKSDLSLSLWFQPALRSRLAVFRLFCWFADDHLDFVTVSACSFPTFWDLLWVVVVVVVVVVVAAAAYIVYSCTTRCNPYKASNIKLLLFISSYTPP